MNAADTELATTTVHVTYDSTQHAMVIQQPQGRVTAMDACPATGGKGREFSPTNLVVSGLAGCMLFSMGVLAVRDGLDLSGTDVSVDVWPPEEPSSRLGTIEMIFRMPGDLTPDDRLKLERAAAACPIHNSFHPDVSIMTRFAYPED